MRISDWSSDVCSSDLPAGTAEIEPQHRIGRVGLLVLRVDVVAGVVDQVARIRPGAARRAGGVRQVAESLAAVAQCRLLEERSDEPPAELQSLLPISFAVVGM